MYICTEAATCTLFWAKKLGVLSGVWITCELRVGFSSTHVGWPTVVLTLYKDLGGFGLDYRLPIDLHMRNIQTATTHAPQVIQVDQLSQRDRAAGWVSYCQKWKTGTDRQYFTNII